MTTVESPATMIKGASIRARLDYVQATHGDETLDAVLAHLDANDRDRLTKRVLPSTLFPLDLTGRLDQAIAAVVDPDHPIRVYRRLGRASADQNLKTFHRIFLRGQGPHDVLSAFPSVRTTYYSDGDASYEATGETSGVLRVVGAATHTLPDCESTAGYFEQAIELMGGRSARVTLRTCRHRGDPHCAYACAWQ